MVLSDRLQNAVFDLVTGAAVFGVFYISLRWAPDNHASILFLIGEMVYLVAGAIRGHSGSRTPVLNAFFIVLPGATTIMLLAYTGYAFTAHLYIICFLGAAFLGTLCGILLRRLFATKKAVLGLLTAAGLCAVSLLTMRIAIPHIAAAWLSKEADLPAPSFTLSAIDGTLVGSDQLRGRVVLLAFWATWCRPCIDELSRVQQVYQSYKNDSRVAIWVVDSGISNDTVEKQRRVISAQHWNLPFAEDSENLEYRMGLHGLPKLILLDKSGRIRWVHDGFDHSEDLAGQLTTRIEELLRSG
jgi:peroxiredoxin